jgi:hypothetical protein
MVSRFLDVVVDQVEYHIGLEENVFQSSPLPVRLTPAVRTS